MKTRRSTTLLVRIVAVALIAIGVVGYRESDHAGGTDASEIGVATQEVRTATATARIGEIATVSTHTSEKVRYDDASLRIVASDTVDVGTLDPAAGTNSVHLWRIVREVWPARYVDVVRQLNIVTDGTGGTLAMVHRSGLDPSTWILSLDDAEPDDVIRQSLVHELAHVLTLDRSDLSVVARTATCNGSRIAIGCAATGSALADWSREFWTGTDGKAVAEPTADDRRAFVTSYSASSVHEDLAESFMAWVLGSAGNSRTLAPEKAAFFFQRAEFVEVRAEVLATKAAAAS
jgi:hypothetical protein